MPVEKLFEMGIGNRIHNINLVIVESGGIFAMSNGRKRFLSSFSVK